MTEQSSRTGFNLVLLVVALVCTAAVATAAVTLRPWEGTVSGGGDDLSGRAGTSVGRGTVTAVKAAGTEEQQRVAAQLEGANKLVNALLNLRYDDIEAGMATVREWATGAFLKQFNAGAEFLGEELTNSESVQDFEVVWAAVVSGDEDSARIILAAAGTVSNTRTKGEEEKRQYRLQVDVTFVDEQWKVEDLQYVATQLGGGA